MILASGPGRTPRAGQARFPRLAWGCSGLGKCSLSPSLPPSLSLSSLCLSSLCLSSLCLSTLSLSCAAVGLGKCGRSAENQRPDGVSVRRGRALPASSVPAGPTGGAPVGPFKSRESLSIQKSTQGRRLPSPSRRGALHWTSLEVAPHHTGTPPSAVRGLGRCRSGLRLWSQRRSQ